MEKKLSVIKTSAPETEISSSGGTPNSISKLNILNP